MKRRKLLKIMGVLGATAPFMLLSGCSEKAENKENIPVESEEKKTNFNRKKMHIADPAHPTKAELKHTPEIKMQRLDDNFTKVTVTVGSQGIIHPTTPDHWIDFIKLYANGEPVGEVHFEAGKARGYATFIVKNPNLKSLKAEIGCNLHGIWENTVSVK